MINNQRDIPDIWFINTHAKSNGGAHNPNLVLHPIILGSIPNLKAQAGMIGCGRNARLHQMSGRRLTIFLGEAVNNARFALEARLMQ